MRFSGEPLEFVGSFVAHFSLGAADSRHRVQLVQSLSHECMVGRDLFRQHPVFFRLTW